MDEDIKASETFKLDSSTIYFKKYKCLKCHLVSSGIGVLFHKNEANGVDRDYKFCWQCWLQWHKDNLGEVVEVVEPLNSGVEK